MLKQAKAENQPSQRIKEIEKHLEESIILFGEVENDNTNKIG